MDKLGDLLVREAEGGPPPGHEASEHPRLVVLDGDVAVAGDVDVRRVMVPQGGVDEVRDGVRVEVRRQVADTQRSLVQPGGRPRRVLRRDQPLELLAPALVGLEHLLARLLRLVVQRHQPVGACVLVLRIQPYALVQVLQAHVDVALVPVDQGEVVVGLRVVRVRVQRRPGQLDGLRHPPHRPVHPAQVLVGEVHARVRLQRLLEAVDRAVEIALPSVEDAQIVVRVRVRRVEVCGQLVVHPRPVPLVSLCVHDAEGEEYVSTLRIVSCCLLEEGRRPFEILLSQALVAKLKKASCHVLARLHAILVHPQCHSVSLQRVVGLPEGTACNAQVVPRLNVGRAELHCLFIHFFGLGRVARLGVFHTQLEVRRRVGLASLYGVLEKLHVRLPCSFAFHALLCEAPRQL
mmetsp:Transcript_62727/g.176908  ORF Transcript_62727/g.176908 Transcript_62727/m.176908 type:complete len:405 (-) Transcript_62727:426-1640(-)